MSLHLGTTHSRSTSPTHSSSYLDHSGGVLNNTSYLDPSSATIGGSGAASDRSDTGTSSAIWYDDFDSSIRSMDNAAKVKNVSHLLAKIHKTRQKIKDEQVNKESNVDEYLRLAGGADKTQQARIKKVFEKKNQDSATKIQELQKKLERDQRKLQVLQEHGNSNVKQTKEVLKIVGHGIKSVGEGVVDTLTRPREFARMIHKTTFGSADNIANVYSPKEDEERRRGSRQFGSASLPREGSISGSSVSQPQKSSFDGKLEKFTRDDRSVPQDSMSSMTSESEGGVEATGSGADLEVASSRLSAPTNLGLKTLMSEITNLKEETERAHKELEEQRQHFKVELDHINNQLREERFKFERLEEQINDLTELHQNEMENIKCGVTDMEEKVQYQSEERIRDIHDTLLALETKISRIEHQASQQLQYVSIDGLDNSNFRAMVVKAINVFLVLLQVILLIMETAAQILKPFVKTPTRTVTTILLITVTVLAFRQWQEVNFVNWKAAFDPRKRSDL